jgi:hypothetical protein
VAALLGNAEAMVRVVGVRLMGFWDMWCRFVAKVVVGGRDGCVVEVVGGGSDYAVAVGGWCWADDGYDREWLHVSALIDEGYRQYTAAL